MNGIVHRSHFSLRLKDISPEVRRGLWKHVVGSFVVTVTAFLMCSWVASWLAG